MKSKLITKKITSKPSLICCLLVAASLTTTILQRAQACDLFPIALSAKTLINVEEGTTLNDILNGSQPGQFGWLSWNGSQSESSLVSSLTLSGNSNTYVNPADRQDQQVNIGDWVLGKPGVSNAKNVRSALDALVGMEIIVPVWSEVVKADGKVAYRVCAFARVMIVSYQLASENRISAFFLGYENCDILPPV